ncbi:MULTISPECIES: YdhK family protein [unclassified Exiguobacterium]|uniref:YdhK family protein n=1 Tax=unclassified Exiguobacterium TaxID=2644629 RepID=UPI001BE8925D|nr:MULTISPECIES: YdhK family protein [unclassified Exiguobacterium]
MKKTIVASLTLSTALLLGACGNDQSKESNQDDMQSEMQDDSHEGMMHSSDGDLPEGIKKATNPKFEVGSTAIMSSKHMKGMDGAEATIAGAFDTIVYAVSFTPTDGGKKVTNHKWVVQEELTPVPSSPLKKGDTTTIDADHMTGMNGAKATIDSAEQTTVYMVDFKPTTGGDTVKNHKWVTEDELQTNE